MKRKIWLVVLAIAAVIAIVWWWQGRGVTKRDARSITAASTRDRSAAPIAPHANVALARLEGRVTTADGAAVPTAVVRVSRRGGEPFTVAAGADGRFTLDALPPGSYVVVAAAPGFLPERKLGVALRRGETTRVELALSLGGTALRGTVTDASGGPIAGAIFTAGRGGGGRFFAVFSGRADADASPRAWRSPTRRVATCSPSPPVATGSSRTTPSTSKAATRSRSAPSRWCSTSNCSRAARSRAS